MSNSKYFGTFPGVTEDILEAAGDGFSKILHNIEVGSDTTVERGMLMAASTPTGTFSLAGAGDTNKYFAIARDDFEADSAHTVCQAWVSGRFHREAVITTGGSDTSVLEALEPEMRRQNLHLTSIKQIFGKYDPYDS